MGNRAIQIQGRKFETFTTMGLKTAQAVLSPGDWAHCTIQNAGTNVLKVYNCITASQADATNLIAILAGCSAAEDGTGGSVKIENCTGYISVAGTSPSYVVAAA